MKKFLFMLAIIFAENFFTSTTFAEIQTCTGKGEYIMSMKETPEFAQQNAKLYAEREALEQAGVFVSSSSVMENFKLKKDEVTAFAAGILKNVKVIKTEMIPLTGEAQGYIKIIIIVEAQIDSDDFETAYKKWQERDSKEKSINISQNNEQQKMISDLKNRIEQLEKDLENAKTAQQKEKVQEEIKIIDKDALYTQKILQQKNKFRVPARFFIFQSNFQPLDSFDEKNLEKFRAYEKNSVNNLL